MTDEEWLKLRKREKVLKIILAVGLIIFIISIFIDISHMFQFFVVIFFISIAVGIHEFFTLIRKKNKRE